MLAACARYLKLPYPSLLALGGTALAFIPNAPSFSLDPQLTLALFVAPALLDAAFDTSLRDLKQYWIPVMTLVFVAVGITIAAVAWLVHYMVPDMPWAACIAIGAIVAPPDAVAASAVMRRLNIPHRVVVILEGESLLNDATALLVYRLAVTATMGATFTGTGVAILSLAMIASAVVGFLLAHGLLRVTERITDVPSAIILQFVTAFGVWILAEEVGLSPIVTLVAFAITAARITPQRTPAELRLPSYAVWETVVFVLNVLAFVLIGLQLRPIFEGLEPADARALPADRGRCAGHGDRGAHGLGHVVQPRRDLEAPILRRRAAGPAISCPPSPVVWWSAGPACAASSRWPRPMRCPPTFRIAISPCCAPLPWWSARWCCRDSRCAR